MGQQDKNDIEYLLPRYCAGELLTDEESLLIKEWISQSEENRLIARQMYALYLATDTVVIKNKVNTEKALVKVKQRSSGNRKTSWWKWMRRTAAVLLIPLLTIWSMQYLERQAQVNQVIVVKTNPGMTTSVILPDSTVVYLNSESSISYPVQFEGDTRQVILAGEAYFEVAKDRKRKFIISTSHHSQIEVLGTHFNVEAYANEAEVSTTLVEGKVSFLFDAKGGLKKQIKLNPGQKLVYNSTNGETRLYATSGVFETAWADGKIVFDNTPLVEGLKKLEKRFNVLFMIKNNRLKDNSFTGVFAEQRLERILDHFKVSSGIQWRYLENADMKNEKTRIEIY